MRSSSTPRHWDGSPVGACTRRSLRIEHDSPSRLLRCAQPDRCRECGNPVEWYDRNLARPVRLHPRELPAAEVPTAYRWHVSSGVAHPAGDGRAWCRLAHATVCPARDVELEPSVLDGLRRTLALNTRRLIDTGAFCPDVPSPRPTARRDVCRPARPVVQLLYVRYLAALPVDEIHCVAQTRHRNRCTQRLCSADTPAGVWTLVPATATKGQLALQGEVMAVYDLTGLPYAEQLRWRMQRCPSHVAAPSAADLALGDWEPFDPFLHGAHIHNRLPNHARRPRLTRSGRGTAAP
ncbi:DUF6083 domain-containing protein [Streptomyces sp. NBC_00638]|uniref:DUF6083 domain-containing protein n=1 Tax=Streptomyces sp. NBC_00638 TaxID=2975794 RepID=UPI002259B4EB|nr:DUF6083 domain-containing protein [Streptomyces sp. NBC_00638]MCX5006681.1 DUF6083 domain-containing protein [Streptomyces sp. NBC_00638]